MRGKGSSSGRGVRRHEGGGSPGHGVTREGEREGMVILLSHNGALGLRD